MSVKIELSGEGLSFSSETSLLKAARIIAFINSEDSLQRAPDMDQAPAHILAPVRTNKSPREAIQESNAKTNPQKILVFANYIITHENKDSFDSASIRQLFRRAGEPEPGNYSRDWREAIKQTFIYETEEKNTYKITDFGESILRTGFTEEAETTVKRKSVGSSSTKKKSSPKIVSDEVKAIPSFVPVVEGLPNYHEIKVKGNRILWILAFADKHGIEELVPADIEYIASRLRDRIPTGSLTALSEVNSKKAFLERKTDGRYKILHSGLEFIKNYAQNNAEKGNS